MTKNIIGLVLFLVVCSGQAFADYKQAYGRGDYATALKEIRPLVRQGDARAQYYLAIMYEKGQGVPQSYTEAVKWYQKAANQGDADSQCNLGNIYLKGEAGPPDYSQGLLWLRKAAGQGNVRAQCDLGVLYMAGKGVAQDARQAVAWFQKAADQGDLIAYFYLGMAYRYGFGVQQNYPAALKCLHIAAASSCGMDLAQYELGVMYFFGLGVARDYAKAYLLWGLASKRELVKPKIFHFLLPLLMSTRQKLMVENLALVARVTRGDRITVFRNGYEENIRLWGVVAPGKGHAFEQEARQFTARLVRSSIVQVIPRSGDHNAQRNAVVYVDGRNLNAELVKAGYAVVDRQRCTSAECQTWLQGEQQARTHHRGQWGNPLAGSVSGSSVTGAARQRP